MAADAWARRFALEKVDRARMAKSWTLKIVRNIGIAFLVLGVIIVIHELGSLPRRQVLQDQSRNILRGIRAALDRIPVRGYRLPHQRIPPWRIRQDVR